MARRNPTRSATLQFAINADRADAREEPAPVVHPCDIGHAEPAPAPETAVRTAELFTITAPDLDGLYAALISHIGTYVPASRLMLIAQSVVGLHLGRVQHCGYVITWGPAFDTSSKSKRVNVAEMTD